MGYNLSSRLLQFRGLPLLTVVNVTRIIASAMATAKILHTFPRRPLMGLDAPKADRDTDHDLAIASVLGSPPGPLADGRDASVGGPAFSAPASSLPLPPNGELVGASIPERRLRL